MKTFIKLFGAGIGMYGIFFAHTAVVYLLPYPWRHINIIMIALTLFIVIRQSGTSVWIAFLLHFLLELYRTTPFGVMLFAGTMATLFGWYAYHTIVTNRSWYAVLFLSILMAGLYRLLYGMVWWVAGLFTESLSISAHGLIIPSLIEVGLSGGSTVLIYGLFVAWRRYTKKELIFSPAEYGPFS